MSVNLQIDKCIEQALPILQRLERAGFEAWIVGGTVRELLRGQMRQVRQHTVDHGLLVDQHRRSTVAQVGFDAAHLRPRPRHVRRNHQHRHSQGSGKDEQYFVGPFHGFQCYMVGVIRSVFVL